MKVVRSMVLISNDPESIVRGSETIYNAFQEQLRQFDLSDEVSVSLVNDIGQSYASLL